MHMQNLRLINFGGGALTVWVLMGPCDPKGLYCFQFWRQCVFSATKHCPDVGCMITACVEIGVFGYDQRHVQPHVVHCEWALHI